MKKIIALILVFQVISLFSTARCEQILEIINNAQHRFLFKIQIVDEKNNPLENTIVHLIIKDGTSQKARIILDTSFTIVNKILFEKSIVIDNSICLLEYEVEKAGYCRAVGSIRKDGNTAKPTKEPIDYITLKKPSMNEIYFNFLCVGVNDQAIPNIRIKYSIIVKDSIIYIDSTIANNNGVVNSKVPYKIGCDDIGKPFNIKIKAESEGYYSTQEVIRDANNREGENFQLKFISRKDYFDPEFIISKEYINLKSKIIGFIDLLQLKSLLTNSILDYYSINIIEFKNKQYLTFDFIHTNEYNSLKLDKYEIAKRIFDEVIRKVLNPLNDNLENSKEFEGYKLMVKTRTRSFTEDKDRSEDLIYEFYIPQNIVKSYKNLDITGQQVLDNSIILLNSERIDLKLQ